MKSGLISAALAAAVVVVTPAPARAQAQDTVREIIGFLVTNQIVPTADFERDRAAAEAARETITRALLANFTSIPIASSSGGFVYRLNPELGTVERATESFGTFFVERALTAGRGRASFGVSAWGAGFDRLAGLELRQGLVTVANRFRDEADPFDVDTLRLRISSSAMTVFGNVGVTDRLEIGAAVPFVRLTVDGDRTNTYFGDTFTQARATATATGIADVAVRAKYAVVATPSGGFAAAFEARLPTGDEENLLGAGSMIWRYLAIGSVEHGRTALHGNAGLVRGAIDELNFGGAATFAAHPRMTISGELLARRVTGLGQISLASAPHPTKTGVDTLRLLADDSAVFISTAVAGIKWNVTRSVVIAGHVARPLTEAGLSAPLSGTLSLEYAVGR